MENGTLEGRSPAEETSSQVHMPGDPSAYEAPTPPPTRRRFHLPLVPVIVIVLLTALLTAFGVYAFRPTPKPQHTTNVTITTQSLDNGTLNKLVPANGTVNQQLTITPNTLFQQGVAIQGSSAIKGNLSVQGTTHMQGNVTIASSLTAGNATIGGNLAVSGQITALSLNIGSLTTSSLNLTNDLTISGHIVPQGTKPAIKASVAAGGGSATIDGNDTAGTITVTVSDAFPHAGELAIITFHRPFSLTPHVQLTAINGAAAGVQYFATRSATFFTLNTANAPTPGTTLVFDYLVTQ